MAQRNRRVRHALPIFLLLFSASLTAAARTEAAPAAVSEPITIWSDGIRLAGDLWKPTDLKADEQRPALLLVHGWGGTKSHLNQAYAPQFAALGYVVLTFDYRGWGESDGKLIRIGEKPAEIDGPFQLEVSEVRTIVDPIDQLEDIENAYHYLIGDSNVDSERLGIWGSSLGGGLALQTAATLPGFNVLITQIGAVNPQSQAALDDADIRQWRTARARGEAPPFPGAETAVEGLGGFPDWPEYVRYDPFASASELTAATLIIDARDEELFDISQNGAALFEAIRERVPARYETLPGKHYDIYRNEGYQAALKLEMDWLREHLPR